MSAPLSGLRVVDITDDSGRFATKLLAEAGASVVRIAVAGATSGPAMASADAAAVGGLLDWWYDGGKQRVDIDLATTTGQAAYRRLAASADLVIDTIAPGQLTTWGIDYSSLAADNPQLVQVSLTPFGQTGPRAGWQTSDLVTAAMSGVLSLTGVAERALNPFGRQSYHIGSFTAVVAALAALRGARLGGVGEHIDISLQEAMTSSIENLYFQYWFDDVLPLPKVGLRQGSLHWLRAYEVVPAATGNIMICPTPSPVPLFEWMAECNHPGAIERLQMDLTDGRRRDRSDMDMTRSFVSTRDAGELFHEAQRRHVAFGEVQTDCPGRAEPAVRSPRALRRCAGGRLGRASAAPSDHVR